MPEDAPSIIIIAGPNGAGKSSTAPALLQLDLSVTEYVNADAIARGLSAFAPDSVAFEAGRVMLERVRSLVAKRASFALETTLSGRTYARSIREWTHSGYNVHLLYVWLSSVDIALERIARRVRLGGHSIPPETVRERYAASIHNLVMLYIPRCTSWMVVDNSTTGAAARPVAQGKLGRPPTILNSTAWNTIQKQADAYR